MKHGPVKAAKLLGKVLRVDSAPRTAQDWLIQISLAFKWFPTEADASEAADKWARDFLTALRQEIATLAALGRVCPFTLNSSSEYMIQGSAYEEPRDSNELKEAKSKRRRFAAYAEALRKLSPREFEAVCVGILAAFGVERPVLTPYSADEGIDFYGRLRLKGVLFEHDLLPSVGEQMGVWLVGQAKHYLRNHVSTFDIRDLVGAVELARSQAYGGSYGKYAELVIRSCDPVFYLIFTTGQLSRSTWTLVRRSGVVAMDGDMVASFLADRGIGVTTGVFSPSGFRRWVAEHGH